MRFLPALVCASLFSIASLPAVQYGGGKPINKKPTGNFLLPQHSSSSEQEVAYASAYSTDIQNIETTGVLTPIHFPTNQLSPVRITHPVAGDDTQFLIKESGIYEIGWAMTVTNQFAGDFVRVELFDLTTATFFNPRPMQSLEFTSFPYPAVSGKILLSLSAGTRLELLASSNAATVANPLKISNPVLIIERIAD